MKFYKLTALFIICLLTLSATANVSAKRHRFHTTLTRIDYNAKEKNFEIIIKMFTHDLMPLLEKRGGKNLDLEKSPEADKLILEYINENFVLSDKNDAAKTLKWIGKDFDTDEVRVFLETGSTENLEGYKLKNTLFFADFPEQTNIVLCLYEGKKADLLYKVGDKIKEIVENKQMTEK